jgi:galactokinase
MTPLAARARELFGRRFGSDPCGVAAAPGRVNLIGEHTDYNDGFVLPMAIDRGVAVAFAPRPDPIVRVHAGLSGETRELLVDPPASSAAAHDWSDYVTGTMWAMARADLKVTGADLAVIGDVPVGAGLSSSAALELATLQALCACAGIDWHPTRMAHLARAAENDFVGVACGVMDQFASALGVEGGALLLDCRWLKWKIVPIPPIARVVVLDTGVRRSLTATAYNERRAACERAVNAVRTLDPDVRSLRDVDRAMLAKASDRMDREAYQRARHVVSETVRPAAMASALEAGEFAHAGRLMNESHASLRDLYEVSSPELDAMVAWAQTQPQCYGARLTGAGFGGCAIALVNASGVQEFVRDVANGYRMSIGRTVEPFVVVPSAGARLVSGW